MPTLIKLILGLLPDLFRSRAALEAEILVLRQQIIVLRRRKPARLPFMPTDKLVLGWVYRLFPKTCDALALVRPETVVRWHRAGFRSYWRWKSRRRDNRVARQITEAFPWEQAPRHLIRDRDQVYGTVVRHRLRAMGIRDKPIAPGSPWQNAYAERLIGSIRRECLDHMVIMSEAHLRRTLQAYASYYNDLRTHRSLDKDAPLSRPVQRVGRITSLALLGGLHHQYVRI